MALGAENLPLCWQVFRQCDWAGFANGGQWPALHQVEGRFAVLIQVQGELDIHGMLIAGLQGR